MTTNGRSRRKVCVAALLPLAASLAGAESQPPSSRGPLAQVTGQALTADGKAAGSRLYSVTDVRETPGPRGPEREFKSASGQTDPDGKFSFEVLPGGLHRLTVWVAKGGWVTRETPIAGDTDLGALRLGPGVTVSGVVVNRLTGEPVPSVKVRATTPQGSLRVPVGELASLVVAGQRVSDESGRFRLNLPEGDHTLGVSGNEWIAGTEVTLPCRNGRALDGVRVEVAPAPLLRGRVRTADGRTPAAGTAVHAALVQSSGARQWRAGTCSSSTEADGSFAARTRPFGAVQMWTFVEGYGHSMGQPLLLTESGGVEVALEVGFRPLAWDFAAGVGPATLFSRADPVELELGARSDQDKGDRCLRVMGGSHEAAWGLWLAPAPLALGENWTLAFDYRLPPGLPLNLYVTSGLFGSWYEIGFAAPRDRGPVPILGRGAEAVLDGDWHRAQVSLSALVRKSETLWSQLRERGCLIALARAREEGLKSVAAPLPSEGWTFWLDNLYVGPP